MARIEAVVNHGNPGFEKTLLPLVQQVPGRSLGDFLIARGIGHLNLGHVQGVKQRDLRYSFSRKALHILLGPGRDFRKIRGKEHVAEHLGARDLT